MWNWEKVRVFYEESISNSRVGWEDFTKYATEMLEIVPQVQNNPLLQHAIPVLAMGTLEIMFINISLSFRINAHDGDSYKLTLINLGAGVTVAEHLVIKALVLEKVTELLERSV